MTTPKPSWLVSGRVCKRAPAGRPCRVVRVEDASQRALIEDQGRRIWVSFRTLSQKWLSH